MVGLRRYVHIAFAVLGLVGFFVFSNIFAMIGNNLSFSYPILGVDIASIAAVVVAGLGAFLLWRNPTVFRYAEEVAEELKKVTWPTYEETRSSTVVVIVMVLAFGVALGLFDFIWSGLTNALVTSLSS